VKAHQTSRYEILGRKLAAASERPKSGPSPFQLMLRFNAGFVLSVLYGLVSLFLVWHYNGKAEAQRFFTVYTTSFKTIISLGLILGTALLLSRTQNIVPQTIEASFKGILPDDYYYYRGRFSSLSVTLRFCGLLVSIGFVIFLVCQFPLSTLGQSLMLIAVCTEYGVAAYIGRKLMYAGLMVHSLLPIKIRRNLFRKRELDAINTCVHVASTLTIIFVYVHVSDYYSAPFSYGSALGQSVRVFLLLPAIIATPVLLIFNFYPRAVLQELYRKSIDFEIKTLKWKLRNLSFSEYEKRSYLIEFDKMSKDELRYSLQLALTDLPIGITILIMVLEPILKR
jgi:hypothetical protein